MATTFTRLAGLSGFVGSILLGILMLAPALFPDSQPFGSLVYGSGTLLLAVFAAGMYRAGNGRLGITARAALVVTLAAFLSIAVLAVLDMFTRLGWGSFEELWPVLVVSAALAFAGLAIYAFAATAAGAIPAWAGVPLGAGGTVFVALLVTAIIAGDRPAGTAGQAIDMAAIGSLIVSAASIAAIGLMLAIGRMPGPSSSPRSVARPST
jgi:hypothetical protein